MLGILAMGSMVLFGLTACGDDKKVKNPHEVTEMAPPPPLKKPVHSSGKEYLMKD